MSRSSLERQRQRGGASFLSQKIDEKNRMKESISQHVTGLPPSLLRLFEARPQPRHLDPIRKRKPLLPYSGVAEYVQQFAEPGDPEYEPPPSESRPPEPRVFRAPEYALQARVEVHTRPEREIYAIQEHARLHKEALEEARAGWDPTKDPSAEGDPFKTLFVARLSYDVSERKLRREFEEFGPVRRIRLVHDKNSGKPRGYAFIEFEHKSDMKEAYKAAEGRKIEGRRILVDVERGRTVPGWQPRRLGGGKGGESRAPRMPKDPKRQVLRRLVEAALPKADENGAANGAEREADMARERDRERTRVRDAEEEGRGRGRGGRDHADRDREHRDRDHRDRDRDYRDRDRDRGRDAGREHSRDHRDGRDYRKRDRPSREYGTDRFGGDGDRGRDAYGGGGGGHDHGGSYNAVPPPGAPAFVPASGRFDDELEEGETRDDYMERDVKRQRERERDA